jgi:hypothetical protein
MRLPLASLAVIVAALTAAAAAPAAPARCASSFTTGGHRWIVVSQLSCAQAMPIARRLPTAPVIRRVTRAGVTVLQLRGPSGWTCATATSTRDRGAACAKNGSSGVTGVTVTVVRSD